MKRISFEISERDLALLMTVSQKHEVSVAQILRTAVSRELSRQRAPAPAARETDGQLLPRLRALLAGPLADARDWDDFFEALRREGVESRASGTGLALHDRETGRKLCGLSELGFPYAGMVRRFGTARSCQRQEELATRYLGNTAGAVGG